MLDVYFGAFQGQLAGLSTLQLALLLNSAVGTLLWWLSYGLTAISARNVPRLSERRDPAPKRWPNVSVVVPARNEAEHVGASLRSLLDQAYPNLQVIAVDDRSTDETGTVIAQLSSDDERLRPCRIETLPPSWLGKVHALQVGASHATGDLLLICDADIHHEPGLLRRAVALMEAEELDLLSLFPQMLGRGLMAPIMATFADGYVQRTLGSREVVTRPGRYFGFGAFMLVRRASLEQTQGLPWLKLDVLDDLALAKLISDSGARCGFAMADDLLSVAWYPTIQAFVQHTEKNFWGGMAGYHWPRCMAIALAAASTFLAPFLGLFSGTALGAMLCCAAWVAVGGAALATRRFTGRSILVSLLSPFAQLALAGIMLRAAIVSIGRTHISWRGTTYSVAELKRGRRVTYP